MSFVRAGQLARHTPTARPDDPIGLVAENLRSSHYGAIPVVDRVLAGDPDRPDAAAGPGARVLGLVDERDLAHAVLPVLERQAAASVAGGIAWEAPPPLPLVNEMNGHHGTDEAVDVLSLDEIPNMTAKQLMRQDVGIVPAAFSLHNALLTLDRYNSAALPVVDNMGGYIGMISRADVIAALGKQVRPPVVGGMATPLGVWLTTGGVNAGAPPLGLFLSGLVLAFCFVAAYLILFLGLAFTKPDWALLFHSGRLGATSGGTVLNLVFTIGQSLIFFLVLRALPMSGIHAAEHQTVWAIERGLPLEPEVVAQMPRAHPRCGTNLVALGALITILFQHLPTIDGGSVLIALLFVYLFWRNFGTALQLYFTTKPATRKQLESGIRAGKQLLEKYQAQPHARMGFALGLLNSGIALSSLGMIIIIKIYFVLEDYLAHLILHV